MGFIHWLKIADERIRKHPHWRKIDGTPWANDAATIAATLAAEAEQAALSALQAEVREVTGPFAKAAVVSTDQEWQDQTYLSVNDSGYVELPCTVGDLRRASALHEKMEG